MERAAASDTFFHFGLFEANPLDGVLRRSGTKVKIQEQPFRLLLLLLERPGEVVSREELRQRLWPEGTYVDFDGSLNVILKRLRAAIGDDPENARFIETVPRRGYRFIAPVAIVPPKFEQAKTFQNGLQQISPQTPAEIAVPAFVAKPSIPTATKPHYWIATAMLATIAAVGGWIVWHH